ncbi:MAG: sensor histidine kinase [Clostridia bacterium]|nr:sensor histidine kinase [Clostridia bacterium]
MLSIFISYLVIIPSSFLCYIPMKEQKKHGTVPTLIYICALLLTIILCAAYLTVRLDLRENDLLLPIFVVSLIVYNFSLNVPFAKTATVFSVVAALMSIMANYAAFIGGILGIPIGMSTYSVWLSVIHLAISSLAALLLAVPFSKYGTKLIAQYSDSKSWYAITFFSVTILLINLVLRPIEYDLFVDHQLLPPLFILITGLLLVWMLGILAFYAAITDTLKSAKMEERNRLLELQEKQYLSQQRYIRASEKARHDFMHSVRTLTELYDAGDIDSVGEYLHQYVHAMPASDIKSYCNNNAVNALLNFYEHIAIQYRISLTLHVNLPDKLPISDVDLCNMIGNILENAVAACQKTEERFIQLSLLVEKNTQLYIVSVNSFNGIIRKACGRYYSTSHKGQGIGLTSIASTAESYNGVAQFSYEGDRFYCNIAIPIV